MLYSISRETPTSHSKANLQTVNHQANQLSQIALQYTYCTVRKSGRELYLEVSWFVDHHKIRSTQNNFFKLAIYNIFGPILKKKFPRVCCACTWKLGTWSGHQKLSRTYCSCSMKCVFSRWVWQLKLCNYSTWLFHGSTSLYFLLHFSIFALLDSSSFYMILRSYTMALLHSSSFYMTLPRLNFTQYYSTMVLLI